MVERVMLCVLSGALPLLMMACQGGGGNQAGRSQESGASRAGKVSSNQTPEMEFLKRIADAAESNDAKKLVSMLHPDVIASFGEEKCIEAFRQEKTPGMVVAGRPVRSIMAHWSNAQGRAQIYSDGPTFEGGVGLMEGPKLKGMTSFSFGADKSGKFYLFWDCGEKAFKADE